MIDILKRFLLVAFAEWKLFYTDAAAVLLLVVASVLYAFYYPLPYKYQTVTKIPVAIVDLDNSKVSRSLVQMADASQQVDVRHVFSEVRDAEAAMANEEIYGFMVIPPNIEVDLQKGQSVNINVFTHGAYVMLHGNISTAFSTCALTLGATTKVKRIALAKKVPAAQAMAMRDPMPLGIQVMYNNTGSYSNYVVPSVLILILQQSLVIGLCLLGGARAHRKFRKIQRDASYENENMLFRYFGRSFAYFVHYCCFTTLWFTRSLISRAAESSCLWRFLSSSSSFLSSTLLWCCPRCSCNARPACNCSFTCLFRSCSCRTLAGLRNLCPPGCRR